MPKLSRWMPPAPERRPSPAGQALLVALSVGVLAAVLDSLGGPVVHIRDERAAEPHRLAAPARLVDGRLTYADDA